MFFSHVVCVLSLSQESIGTRSAPVGDTSGVNAASSPAKSMERVNSEEQKVVKLKPQALTNVTSEAVSTMSPPPAKRLALSAKKVSLPAQPALVSSAGGIQDCLFVCLPMFVHFIPRRRTDVERLCEILLIIICNNNTFTLQLMSVLSVCSLHCCPF